MTGSVAKLNVYNNDQCEQEFLLNQDFINIGRAPENNLVLSPADISRYHAQISRSPNGYFITDLGSSIGTSVNQVKLLPKQPQSLADGDTIGISTYKLHFSIITPVQNPHIQSTQVVASQSSLPATILALSECTPILTVKTSQGSQHFELDRDRIAIGREPGNDIVIVSTLVSGRHAEIRKQGNVVEIVDLGSTNGLSFSGQRIAHKVLADGDVLQIGTDVTLTYSVQSAARVEPVSSQTLDLRNCNRLTFGRDSQNNTVINHPAVSRFHAEIKKQGGSWVLTDLDSTNGTFINGKQILGDRVLMVDDTIRIGSCSFVFNMDETLVKRNEEGNLRLDALHLNKVVGKGVNLLQDISLSVLAREFVVIAGVSGGGKSTLLDALNGFRPATSGSVLVNNVDLYKNFNAYRTELGYVPQKDIVHTELTVFEALNYAAKLRMPADTTKAERLTRVEEVLEDLQLTHRRDVPIKNLSGGQLKRVSMGVELLTKPSLFFLDEATSGLDPGTEADIMQLLRKLANQGRTVLLITHATKNVKLCDLVMFLAKGGYVAYFGPPNEVAAYFGVEDFDEVYSKVERELSPSEWQQRYLKSRQYQKYVVERQSAVVNQPQAASNVPATGKQKAASRQIKSSKKSVSALRQFVILSERNLSILIRDRASLILMLAVAPILGLLDFVTFKPDLFDLQKGDASQAITMLFTTALIAVMVGSLSTMREIVKEQEIYRRERMIGLQLIPYIFSKVWIGVPIALYQAAIFLLFKKLAIDIPGGTEVLGAMYVALFLATLSGMVMGLLVSALAPNQNVAPLLTIIFLVPQITFGGGMLPIHTFGPPGEAINRFTLTKWPFETLVTITGIGKDVANDTCWTQKTEDDRKNLSDEEKDKCGCLGPNLFTQCKFPGISSKYDPAVDQPEPKKPVDPGDPPPQPKKPSEKSLNAQQRYEDDLDQYQKDIDAYQDKVKSYKKDIDRWQNEYSDWKGKYESAIGEAEGTISKFYKNYGKMFNVPLAKHWSILGGIMAAMLALLVVVQKRKDII